MLDTIRLTVAQAIVRRLMGRERPVCRPFAAPAHANRLPMLMLCHVWWKVGTAEVPATPTVTEQHAEVEAGRVAQRQGA